MCDGFVACFQRWGHPLHASGVGVNAVRLLSLSFFDRDEADMI